MTVKTKSWVIRTYAYDHLFAVHCPVIVNTERQAVLTDQVSTDTSI